MLINDIDRFRVCCTLCSFISTRSLGELCRRQRTSTLRSTEWSYGPQMRFVPSPSFGTIYALCFTFIGALVFDLFNFRAWDVTFHYLFGLIFVNEGISWGSLRRWRRAMARCLQSTRYVNIRRLTLFWESTFRKNGYVLIQSNIFESIMQV